MVKRTLTKSYVLSIIKSVLGSGGGVTGIEFKNWIDSDYSYFFIKSPNDNGRHVDSFVFGEGFTFMANGNAEGTGANYPYLTASENTTSFFSDVLREYVKDYRILTNSNTNTEMRIWYASGLEYIHNIDSPTSDTPSEGGFLYTEDGALKYKGSSGTVTTIAPA